MQESMKSFWFGTTSEATALNSRNALAKNEELLTRRSHYSVTFRHQTKRVVNRYNSLQGEVSLSDMYFEVANLRLGRACARAPALSL